APRRFPGRGRWPSPRRRERLRTSRETSPRSGRSPPSRGRPWRRNVPSAANDDKRLAETTSTSSKRPQSHAGHAVFRYTEGLRRGEREVDDPASYERAAVVDSHHDRAVVLQVGDLEPGTERQAPVCRGQRVLVEGLAAGRRLAL